MANVFFSYSHKDEHLRDELEVHLAQLKRSGVVTALHDRRITAGERLDAATDRYLEEADVILCLLSPDFIDSDYCVSREMTRALQRDAAGEARVIPVIVRHCDWRNTPLAALRGTPRDNRPVKAWADRDEAWLDVANDVRAAVSAVMSKHGDVGERSAMPPQAAPATVVARPRSANVAVERRLTDLDRDRFARSAFEFVAEFFANSLDEVRSRSPDVDGTFTNLDANRFTAAAYRDGRKITAITVYFGGMSRTGRGISFHLSDSGETGISNGSFHVGDDGSDLGFETIFGSEGPDRKRLQGQEEVAERIWSAFFGPLGRPR